MAMIMPCGGLMTASNCLIPNMPMLLELDVDGQIDVRDLLLRLGEPARDGLADVRKLDRFVRDRLFDHARHDQMRRGCGCSCGSRRGWRCASGSAASCGIDVGSDDPAA